jgi:hypothetical protein
MGRRAFLPRRIKQGRLQRKETMLMSVRIQTEILKRAKGVVSNYEVVSFRGVLSEDQDEN